MSIKKRINHIIDAVFWKWPFVMYSIYFSFNTRIFIISHKIIHYYTLFTENTKEGKYINNKSKNCAQWLKKRKPVWSPVWIGLTLFRPGFFGPSLTGGGGGTSEAPLCNFQNIKAITMKLTGCIVCPNIFLLVYVTWDDDDTSRDNYIMMSKQPASWICHLRFQKFFNNAKKPPKITAKNTKSIKLWLKTVKGEKITLQLIHINRNTKITNLGKHACQNAVAMVISSSWYNNLSYQIISR